MRSSPRRRAREFVLQGLYQQQLSGNADEAIRAQLAEATGFAKADRDYFATLWTGIHRDHGSLLARIAPYLDRGMDAVSPIERAILVIGAWELVHALDIPYRVVINEAVELAKSYGGIDGHKYVNGVLDKLAAQVRGDEIRALAAERGRAPG